MPFCFKEEDKKTATAFDNPQVGDRFTEMYSFWLYVVGRKEDKVATLEASPPCTFPEDGKLKIQTVEEFKKRFAYGSIDGYSLRFAGGGHNVEGWLEEGVWKCK